MSKPTTSQTYLFETAFVVAAWALWVVLSSTARADEKLPETQYHIDGAGILATANIRQATCYRDFQSLEAGRYL
ncbi:hypothetical protein WDW37_11165 [Bdellovibrionota bacterium FG-1]